MINTFIGNLGHFSVILAFVAAIVSALGYFMASFRQPLGQTDQSWRNLGRGAFFVHVIAVLGIIISLFDIIYNHRYEYHYAWSHSSNHLPTHYMISCFWEGQEGSFLLWIFWHTILGLILIKFNRKWEAPAMAVFAFVQLFLTSMILGVVIGDLKIGSSPFILLRDFMVDAPVFKLNPNFIPKDGTGLNVYPLFLSLEEAARFPLDELHAGYRACLEANAKLVTTQLDDKIVLERLLVGLLAPKSRR